MVLILFAHRGEAQVFLRELKATPLAFPFPHLFEYSKGLILITGEGLYGALEKTASLLGHFTSIKEVWNLGVAGALRPEIEVGQIYPLRTLYCLGKNSRQTEFQSYTTAFQRGETQIDCISSPFPILNACEADHADAFAPLVDREAWAMARACQLFKLPFYSVKLASDRPAQEEQICQRVKANSEVWSDQLYRWFQKEREGKKEQKSRPTPALSLSEFPNLYFTVTTERKLHSLVDAFKRKGLNLEEIKILGKWNELQDSSLGHKDRAKKFLHQLQDSLCPLPLPIQNKVEKWITPLRKAGIQVHFDPLLDSRKITLKTQIQDASDLEKLQEALKKFSFDEFFNV